VFTKACFKGDAVHCTVEILHECHSTIQSAPHSTDIAQENNPLGKGAT